MDLHAPDGHAADDGSQRDTGQKRDAVVPGELAAPVGSDADQDKIDELNAASATERVADVPWLSLAGGPTVLYRAYFDFDPSAGALNLAEYLIELCQPHGVTVEIKGIDEYKNIDQLRNVHGLFCVFSSAPRSSWRPGSTTRFRQLARDFRSLNPVRAVDGFYAGSDRWHRVRVLQAFYTDDALDDQDCLSIIDDACVGHPYAPDVQFTGKIFEIFEPGMAQQVKENDRVAANHVALWKRLRRWGVDSADRAQVIRDEIESEVDSLEDRSKRVMSRPIHGRDHNQLWLVLHDTDARPPADPDKSAEENRQDVEKFVANSARAVRDLVKRLEATYDWFRQPNDVKVRGAQRHFVRLHDALRNVTMRS